MSYFSASVIKSIQRGIVTIPDGSSTATISLTTVDTTKTVVNFLGASYTWTAPGSYQSTMYRLQLTNATTLTATRDSTGGTLNVSYEIVEFK